MRKEDVIKNQKVILAKDSHRWSIAEIMRRGHSNQPRKFPISQFYKNNGFLYIYCIRSNNEVALTDDVTTDHILEWDLDALELFPQVQEKLE